MENLKFQQFLARRELENISIEQFELLKKFTLDLFDQNEAHKQLLLTIMKNNLIGSSSINK